MASTSTQPSPALSTHVLTSFARQARCLHCRALLASDQDGYCCAGCKTVHGLITRAGLERYYTLRGADGEPAIDVRAERRDLKWIAPIAVRLAVSEGVEQLRFQLQGIRCAACVWLISQLFAKLQGAVRAQVNVGRGVIDLYVRRDFPLEAFVTEVEAFGYVFGEDGARDDTAARAQDDLLLRTAVCLALGGNAMMFAAAIYLGLSEGPVYRLLHALNFACASLAVLIGGPVFVRSAWQAVRRGLLHLDLPIAVGIVLTYGAALWSFATGNTRAAYYDSLATFIGLMLLGRWLKQRIVLDNQRKLLSGATADNLWVRRIAEGRVELVRAPELRAGDEVLVPSADLVPAPSDLLDDAASLSLDWINGESEPRPFARGELIPAGAFNASASALHLRTRVDFAGSPLSELLSRTRADELAAPARYRSFSAIYVASVLLSALGGFLYWAVWHGQLVLGLEVATAICVVTCPCAIGIATPLAYDLVQAGLRRAGLYVRSQTFLDRATKIRRVVFDKTGTLSTGRLALGSSAALDALTQAQLDALYTLVCASVHPKSLAVQRALEQTAARLVSNVVVSEVAGQGLCARIDACEYRLGQRAFACDRGAETPAGDDLVFSEDGLLLCALSTREVLRADAKREIAELANDGYEAWILSGDDSARVRALAQSLDVPERRTVGGASPEDKAAWITQHDRSDVLMVGDGINDSLAVANAFASGTPSIDRVFMPWRTDFFFVTPGLAPIRVALRAARRLARVVRGNQVFAVAYNVITVAIALAGGMRPWMAAVLMPLSSIVVLAMTSWSLSARSRVWKP